ncbi:hypothetical protein PR202_gb21671 [Eleusine coracana subsp. coracana]|uniref:Uncharacterized protein n=1 Tax=Eleusine coracana subsp. coracana TaxID=191504 RepID=A0AAV5FDQ9_ELECO|nr:hypothetical protein PR202_gb21671 [Eleusine coracana subsp. coracana]
MTRLQVPINTVVPLSFRSRCSSIHRFSPSPSRQIGEASRSQEQLRTRSVPTGAEAMEKPPPFQESAHCDVCRCTFSTFRRRALPQFGIYTDVRVCLNCFNKSSSRGRADNAGSPGNIFSATESFSGLNLGEKDGPSPTKDLSVQSTPVIECKCGMPLCICEAPKPEPAPVKQNISVVPSSAPSNPRPKKPYPSQQKASASSSSNSSSFFNLGPVSNNSSDKGVADYEVTGEGLREAIKSGDVSGVKKLLSQAALFNQTEVALILMDHGANVQSKNGQGTLSICHSTPMT